MYSLLKVKKQASEGKDENGSFFRELNEKSQEMGLLSQCIKIGPILGKRHLDTAAINSFKNFHYGRNHSKLISLEILVMLSAQRQISEAMNIFGIDEKDDAFILIVMDKNYIQEITKNPYGDSAPIEDRSQLNERAALICSKMNLRIIESYGDIADEEDVCLQVSENQEQISKPNLQDIHFFNTNGKSMRNLLKAANIDISKWMVIEDINSQIDPHRKKILSMIEKIVCESICLLNA